MAPKKMLATLISRNRRLLRGKILLTVYHHASYEKLISVSFPEFAFCVYALCVLNVTY